MPELQTLVTYECYGISASAAIGYGSIAFGKVRSGGARPCAETAQSCNDASERR